MSLLDDEDFPHADVTIGTKLGRGPRGDVFAAPVNRTVIIEDGRQLVRDADGEQVVSSTTLFDRLDQAAIYTPGSKVAVGDRTAHVITARRRDLDPDVAHLEIALT